VLEAGPGRCILDWEGYYRVATADEELGARTLIEVGYTALFAGFVAACGG
jgi:hypothetical protein